MGGKDFAGSSYHHHALDRLGTGTHRCWLCSGTPRTTPTPPTINRAYLIRSSQPPIHAVAATRLQFWLTRSGLDVASTTTHRDTDPASPATCVTAAAPRSDRRPQPDHWEWQKAGRYLGEDLTIFFGAVRERGRTQDEREARAKRICAECTVIAERRH